MKRSHFCFALALIIGAPLISPWLSVVLMAVLVARGLWFDWHGE